VRSGGRSSSATSGIPRAAPTPAHVRGVKEQHAELRTIPRVSSLEQVEPMLEAGAEGAIVSFPDEAAMRELARRYR
jgi:hypothetical protein